MICRDEKTIFDNSLKCVVKIKEEFNEDNEDNEEEIIRAMPINIKKHNKKKKKYKPAEKLMKSLMKQNKKDKGKSYKRNNIKEDLDTERLLKTLSLIKCAS
jgi:hypothetical protein